MQTLIFSHSLHTEFQNPLQVPRPRVRSHLTIKVQSKLTSKSWPPVHGLKPPVAPKPRPLSQSHLQGDTHHQHRLSNGELPHADGETGDLLEVTEGNHNKEERQEVEGGVSNNSAGGSDKEDTAEGETVAGTDGGAEVFDKDGDVDSIASDDTIKADDLIDIAEEETTDSDSVQPEDGDHTDDESTVISLHPPAEPEYEEAEKTETACDTTEHLYEPEVESHVEQTQSSSVGGENNDAGFHETSIELPGGFFPNEAELENGRFAYGFSMLPTVTEEYPYDLIGPTDDASDTCESCDTAETGDTEVWQPERATKDPSGCFRFTSSTEDVFGPYSVIEAVPEDTSSTADPEWNPGEEDKSSSANESQTQDACNQEPYYVSSDDVDKLEDEQANSEELHNEDATEQSFQHKDKEKDIESADEYADIDDSICLKDNAEHSNCVSSEDYVEIGEEDEEEEVEKKHIRVKSANKRTAQREQALRSQRKSCQPRLRLCNITVPADLDFGCTPELTNRVVFAHTTEAFEEDIEELDCHIVPYYEDTDSDSDEHIYVEVGFESEGENVIPLDRKTIVTRSRSYSGKVSNYVPETVPEETGTETHDYCTVPEDKSSEPLSPLEQPAVNCITPSTKSRRFLLSSRSADGPGLSFLTSAENDQSLQNEIRIRRKDDTLSLPCVITSSGSFSQRSHQSSSGVSTPTSLADIPPPFELVPITKRPVTKSSPSLLIQHELSETPKKKKSSFKRFLAFKFKRKTDPKGFSDGSVRSSRSSSESSHHGVRLKELDRRSNGSSPQLQSAMVSPQQHPSNLPSSLILCKDPHRRKGDLKADGKGVSRVESFEERSRRPIMPLPMTKPRSISFPSADTSDYENIPAMSSDYENIQIPGRPTRSHTVTEYFENPNRTTVMSNENDGYVDMNSFPGIDSKPQTLKVDSER